MPPQLPKEMQTVELHYPVAITSIKPPSKVHTADLKQKCSKQHKHPTTEPWSFLPSHCPPPFGNSIRGEDQTPNCQKKKQPSNWQQNRVGARSWFGWLWLPFGGGGQAKTFYWHVTRWLTVYHLLASINIPPWQWEWERSGLGKWWSRNVLTYVWLHSWRRK